MVEQIIIHDYLHNMGVHSIAFKPNSTQEEVEALIEKSGKADKLAMIYAETPANPTNAIVDVVCAVKWQTSILRKQERSYCSSG